MLRKLWSLKIRVLGLILCLGMLSMPLGAAGEGYSDPYRFYSIQGLDGNVNLGAAALLYGNEANTPEQNYAIVYKFDGKRRETILDVVSGTQLNAMLQNCIASSQMDVNAYNEVMLSNGAPDEWLLLEEKPPVIDDILKAVAAGESSVTVKDYLVIYPDTLGWAAGKGGEGFWIHCDTMNGKKVNVRISVNPSHTTKGVVVAAITDEEVLSDMIAKYEKRFDNRFAAIQFFQEGSFGTTVQVSAKVNLKKLDTQSLHFYSVNRVANTYVQIENPNYSIDDNGYLTFQTTEGGTMLITDRPLTQK